MTLFSDNCNKLIFYRSVFFFTFWILLLDNTYGQNAKTKDLFDSEEILEIKLAFSFKDVRKKKDKKDRTPTVMLFNESKDGWDSLDVEVRARGKL